MKYQVFFDVTGRFRESADDENDFYLGQAKIGQEKEFSQIAGVRAYNNETDNFELGTAELGLKRP